jgi:hypothetical protein
MSQNKGTDIYYGNDEKDGYYHWCYSRIGRAISLRLLQDGFSMTVGYGGNAAKAQKVT